jgi:ketosteroid isomerase-like protein
LNQNFESYLLTPDGRFAVAQSNLSMKATSTGKWVSTPAAAVLELKDGKIVNETWYYDGELYR